MSNNRFKSGSMLFIVIALSGILTVCGNPAASNNAGSGNGPNNPSPAGTKSTDNTISNLTVNGEAASAVAGFPDDFTALVPNDIEIADICFDKPLGATASFRIEGDPYASLDDPDQHCTVPDIPFDKVGIANPNHFTITIKSESGSSATYYLAVRRESPDEVMVSSVTLAPLTWTLSVEKTVQLTETVLPEDATLLDVNWSSSDNTKASVSSEGLVTAIARGTVTITATAQDGSGKYGTATVNVKSITSAITGLPTVNGNAVSETPPNNFNITVDNNVTQAVIKFVKPLGATAVIKNSANANVASFNDIEQSGANCTATIPVVVGDNSFTIISTSEDGNFESTYGLTITVKTKADVTTIVWQAGTDLIPRTGTFTVRKGGTYSISLDTNMAGPFTWAVDAEIVVDDVTGLPYTGKTYTFDSSLRAVGTYQIGVYIDGGSVGGDAVTITVTN